MSPTDPILHLFCGKIASGKSTMATKLADAPRTIIVREDDWLAALYSDEMSSVSDYVRYAERLRGVLGPHIVSLLKCNVSIVLDFPANTIASRTWMREIIQSANVSHELHYLKVPDKICLARLRKRNADGDHAFAATDEQFQRITKHFVEPTAGEGFNIIEHQFEGS